MNTLVCTRCGKAVNPNQQLLLLQPCDCGCCVFKSSNTPKALELSRLDLKLFHQLGIEP
jgi:hypothetical protein